MYSLIVQQTSHLLWSIQSCWNTEPQLPEATAASATVTAQNPFPGRSYLCFCTAPDRSVICFPLLLDTHLGGLFVLPVYHQCLLLPLLNKSVSFTLCLCSSLGLTCKNPDKLRHNCCRSSIWKGLKGNRKTIWSSSFNSEKVYSQGENTESS